MVSLVKFLSWLFACMPLGMALGIGRALGCLIGDVLRIRRAVVLDGLRQSFPDKSSREINRLASGVYKNQGMNIIEMLRVSVKGLDDLEGRITVEGAGQVEAINQTEAGSLFLMAHVGNWEMTGYSSRVLGKPATVVVKPIKNKGLHDHLQATREKMQLKMLPHRGAFRECLRVLREQELLAIVLDQNRSREDGVFVEFFERPACTTPGLAVISYQTKHPVYPLFCMRKNNREFVLFVKPPIEVPPDRAKETLVAYTQKYTKAIEDIIREYPEQWLWLHKRWKTQPLLDEGDG